MSDGTRAPPRGLFAAWGRFVHRRRGLVLAGSALVLVLSVLAFTQAGQLTNAAPGSTEAGRGFALIRDELPSVTGSSFILVYAQPGLAARDPAFEAAVNASLAPLRADARVAGVVSPYDAGNPLAPTMVSEDGARAFVVVNTKDEFKVARNYYRELRDAVSAPGMEVLATGNLAVQREFDETLAKDVERAELVSLPITLVLLLLVFGAVVAALLPLGVGILAVAGGLGVIMLLARWTEVSSYSTNITTLIGLGVAIDYSLFMVNRFREEMGRGASTADALERTMATTGRAIFFSGLTVAIGLAGLLFFQGSFLVSMGLAGTIVVAFAVFYALAFLAAILAYLGPRVDKGRIFRPKERAAGKGVWRAIALAVMRRPVVVLVASLAVIVAAGAPFLSIHLASGDVRSLPPHAESRRGYETLVSEFPAQDQTRISVLLVYGGGEVLTAERVGQAHDAAHAIARLPDVLRVEGIVDTSRPMAREEAQRLYAETPRDAWPAPAREAARATVGERVILLSALTAKEPQSDAAREIVRAIRAMGAPAGAELVVTGATAFDMDFVAFILDHIAPAVAFVMVVTYVLLLLLVGSVLLPLKAVLMNLLSISASFGALVWIFQQGHGSGLLGFTPGPIDPSLPVIMFCVVFGLSMDYEVMMLARMQEEFGRTRDNRAAVAEGLERTGRLITGAAAIMVVVFAAFGLADVVIIKAVGLGLALAVAIDATIVRALVVPATMRLLGDLNWWGPKFLKRLAQAEH
ncbi:MAG TPA: MMPL family transporter [Candidatus Thermoplasmatota archaeon]|nr:MMPL family transporter [Candidatus Thermoplasmatota archaeon]